MRHRLILLFALLLALPSAAQINLKGYHQSVINLDLLDADKAWKAQWITSPDAVRGEYGVYHFRKQISLASVPKTFYVHLSADNRYKLYVNGQLASLGPALGDQGNWNFETIDLAPFLKAGENTLAAVVWNYGPHMPESLNGTQQVKFIMQGNNEAEAAVNTDKSWKTTRNTAYQAHTQWRVLGYYAAGPGESIDAASYPWGWQEADFDDTAWKEARPAGRGIIRGATNAYGLQLVPSPIPSMTLKEDRLETVRTAEGISLPKNFLKEPTNVVVPAHSKVHLLLDNQVMTTGYFSLLFGKGKDAQIKIKYTEALYEKPQEGGRRMMSLPKGNRNEVEGKTFIGYEDVLKADGGENRLFTSLWWRTWRYVDVEIETKEEVLVLNDIYGTFTAYPFEQASSFEADNREDLQQMLEIGWRTAQLCAHETYMDCPYYEQLQYFGDTRIQTMITMYNTHDPYMVKNVIEQGRQSFTPEGITLSRYPSNTKQYITSYALSWIGICYDYWMHRGDEAFVKLYLPQMRSILAWYEQFLKPDYSLKRIPFWFFADWSAGFNFGAPAREKEGNSAYQDLVYLLALEEVSAIEKAMGLPAMATHYESIAANIRKDFHAKYWDEGRRMFADTHDHSNYSQHVNTLAVLAGMIQGDEAKDLMMRILADKSLNQATIYFRYYVQQAMDKAGMGNELINSMDVLREQMALGLTTWAEQPEPSRSDCHAWGATPNIEFYRIILGVRPAEAGFRKVLVEPAPNGLKEVSGSVPHPKGDIKVAYKVKKNGELDYAHITLPEGVSGTFVWQGKSYPLKGGEQKF